MKAAIFIASSLFCACSNISSGQSTRMTFMGTAADLVDRCKLPDNPKERDLDWLREYSACAAYVEGVFEANQEAGDLGVCFPEKMNALAFPGDVVRYRRQHPDRLGWSAARFALEAIREAYPCTHKPS